MKIILYGAEEYSAYDRRYGRQEECRAEYPGGGEMGTGVGVRGTGLPGHYGASIAFHTKKKNKFRCDLDFCHVFIVPSIS